MVDFKKATKAVKAKATATAKKTTALVPWTEKFAQYAKAGKEQTQNLGGGGVGVKFGRGTISVGDTVIKSGKLECVILGSCALNAWYEGDYDPNDKQPPDCYAFALVAGDPEMAPHASVANKQADNCADCKQNVFGTAKVGKGKACANKVRLGIITGADAEDAATLSTAELATAHVSPTNLKRWKSYVDALEEEHGRPTWAVVTEIASYDDPKTQIRLEFKLVSLIDDEEILVALEKRYLKIQDVLQVPYAAPSEKPAKSARGSKVVGKSSKFAGGKGAARK